MRNNFSGGAHRIERFSFGVPWEETHGYAQALRIGDEIRISGQIPHDEAGTLVGDGDVRAQSAAVFANLDRVLAGMGVRRDQVSETTIYVVDLGTNFAVVSEAHRSFFAGHLPTSSALGVSELVLPGQLVEISAIARSNLK